VEILSSSQSEDSSNKSGTVIPEEVKEAITYPKTILKPKLTKTKGLLSFEGSQGGSTKNSSSTVRF
jgi:serine/threonine protein kinase